MHLLRDEIQILYCPLYDLLLSQELIASQSLRELLFCDVLKCLKKCGMELG